MAASPAFASTVNTGSGLVPATADTSRTAPTHVTTIFTAGASGSKVEEIVFQGVGTTVLGGVCVFLVRSGTYYLVDEQSITAVTPSTTVIPFRLSVLYKNLMLKSGDTLAVTTQIAGNQSLVNVTAFGGDF